MDESIDSSGALLGVKSEALGAIQSAQEIYDTIRSAIERLETLGDLGIDVIVANVFAGKYRSIKDITYAFPAVKRLPSLIRDIYVGINGIQNHVQNLESSGPQFMERINMITAGFCFTNIQGNVNATENAKTATQQIRSLFQEDIVEHAI